MTTDPAETFTTSLRRLGARPERRDGLIVYQVEPVTGRLAGEIVPTAVEVGELAMWPIAPPHWLHLPGTVVFVHTNIQPSPIPSWHRHSRQIADWGSDPDPAQGWLAHVRGVLGEAR